MIFWLGVYLFVLGVAAMMYSVANPVIASWLWLSYITLVLIGLGMMMRIPELIAMQACIILIPVLFWDIDFVVSAFGGKFLGLTTYFFDGSYASIGKFISLQHLYTLPIAIWSLWKMKLKRDVWKWSFVEVAIVFVLSYFFTKPILNINCVFESCVPFIWAEGWKYLLAWVVLMGLMVWIVNWGLMRFFNAKEVNRRKL